MRVAMISKADSFGGGASRVAEQLADGLDRRGHLVVHWLSWTKKGYTPLRRRIYGELWQRKFYRWTRACKNWFAPDLIPFELPNLYLQNIPANFDVVHFHDLSTAISPLTVAWFAKRMPTVWTFHDASPFTGGCIFPMTCDRFRIGCGECPQHGLAPLDSRYDYTRLDRWVKARVQRSPMLRIVPSRWLRDLALSSGVVPVEPRCIPNGIDLDTFHPAADKAALRAELGLPADRRVVVFASNYLNNHMKGANHAIRALHAVADCNPLAVFIGQSTPELEASLAGLDYRLVGHVGDSDAMARYFAASDILLYPTLADSQSLIVTEAMACGAAVVGYATGPLPELIEDGVLGRLVPTGDEGALQQALRDALSGDATVQWSALAADRARERYAFDHMLDAYLTAYEDAIRAWPTAHT